MKIHTIESTYLSCRNLMQNFRLSSFCFVKARTVQKEVAHSGYDGEERREQLCKEASKAGFAHLVLLIGAMEPLRDRRNEAS